MRYEKTVDGQTINHVWDGSKQIIADVIDNQFYEADCYIRGTNLVAKYNYKNGDKSEYTYYTQNAHGDVVNLTDKDGKVTKKYTYDAFGVEKNIDENDTNAFRYCGEYYDTETGTIYLRARYYNPSTGRFISRDSYAGRRSDPLSLNLYTYCKNNPLRYVDPSGHNAVSAAIGAAIGIAATVTGVAIGIGVCTAVLSSCNYEKTYKYEEPLVDANNKTLISKKQIESFECLGSKWDDISSESVDELNRLLQENDITETWEIKHFMSQATLETGYGFNLTEDTDGEYLENRSDLGNVETGDGYKYRGGGYMHLTGRYNYSNFATYIGDNKILSEGSEYVATHYAWKSAVWYWSNYVSDYINEYSTVEDVTWEINGGYNGLDDRRLIYEAWGDVLG